MQFVEATGLSVRSAVWVLQRRETPLRFHLFCMLHFGSQAYYDEIAARLGDCDVVVAEGHPESPRRFNRLRLGFYGFMHRARSSELVYQHIDYDSLGVPLIWPDTHDPEPEDAVSRVRRPLSAYLKFALFLLTLPLAVFVLLLMGGRRFVARSVSLNIEDNMDWLSDSHFDALVLGDRDALLVAALARLHEERAGEPIDIAVVYGAAHMPGVVRGLNTVYGYGPTGGDWLTVHGLRF
ncbi:hypothetical protein [Streptomyces sp. NBC_01262]|uniref:hypothetical protein n=1 Tax=Streptomyces sp. NBC_01262 TaxID=2903803 RepID=UPI002E34B808|nr:hypothetical protein [Streptomyces sp. NBC_01262]